MQNLTRPSLLYLKAALFVIAGSVAAALLIVQQPTVTTALLLVIAVWAFCRAYYFAFYVVERYVDPAYRFSGLWSFVRYLMARRRGGDAPVRLKRAGGVQHSADGEGSDRGPPHAQRSFTSTSTTRWSAAWGTKRIPMPHVVQHVRELHAAGAVLYLWSRGGEAYAREVAIELDIAHCFRAFLPKPSIIIDDEAFDSWQFVRSVHPSWCRGMRLEDYPEDSV